MTIPKQRFHGLPRLFQYLQLAAIGSLLHVCSSCSPEETETPKPVGPSQALIEKAARKWALIDLPVTSSKRGATLISTAGGILPENTTVFPVQIELGDSSNSRTGGLTVVLYFFQDEFAQWQFFPKDNPENVRRIE